MLPYNLSSLAGLFLPLAPVWSGKPKFHKNWSTCSLLHSAPAHFFLQQTHVNEGGMEYFGGGGRGGTQRDFTDYLWPFPWCYKEEWPFPCELIHEADRHTLLNNWAKCSRSHTIHQNDRPEVPLFIPPCSIKISNKSSIC